MDQEITQHGAHNEGLENRTGYNQAVSGLCDMTPEYDRMFTAECHYWLRVKRSNPELWKKHINRFKHSRGTDFTSRLLKCIKWLERRGK